MNAFLPERLATLDYWIAERERMRLRHAARKTPYTRDRVLAKWRFCNVRRMDDHVSRWLMRYWYVGVRAVPNHALAAATLARYINLPQTLVELFNVPWGDWDEMKSRLWLRAFIGAKTFDPAYKISGGGNGKQKYEAVVDLAAEVQRRRIKLSTHSMRETWADLCAVKGIGPFMAGQIVADVRRFVAGQWVDKHRWAPMGPGSAKGMAYLLGRDGSVSQSEFDRLLPAVIEHVRRTHPIVWRDRELEAHDVQNSLCELSKFVRGKGKQPYTPRPEVRP